MKLTEFSDFDVQLNPNGSFKVSFSIGMQVVATSLSKESLIDMRDLIDEHIRLSERKNRLGSIDVFQEYGRGNSNNEGSLSSTIYQAEQFQVFSEYFPSVITEPEVFLKMQDYMEESKRAHLYNRKHGRVLGVLVKDVTGSFNNPGLSKENEMGVLFQIPKTGYEHLRSEGKVELNSLDNHPEVIYFLIRTKGPACKNFIDKYFGGKVFGLNGEILHTREESVKGVGVPYKILRSLQRDDEEQLSTRENYIPSEIYLDRNADVAWRNPDKELIKRALDYVVEQGGL